MDHKRADYNHGMNMAHKQKMTVTGRKYLMLEMIPRINGL